MVFSPVLRIRKILITSENVLIWKSSKKIFKHLVTSETLYTFSGYFENPRESLRNSAESQKSLWSLPPRILLSVLECLGNLRNPQKIRGILGDSWRISRNPNNPSPRMVCQRQKLCRHLQILGFSHSNLISLLLYVRKFHIQKWLSYFVLKCFIF